MNNQKSNEAGQDPACAYSEHLKTIDTNPWGNWAIENSFFGDVVNVDTDKRRFTSSRILRVIGLSSQEHKLEESFYRQLHEDAGMDYTKALIPDSFGIVNTALFANFGDNGEVLWLHSTKNRTANIPIRFNDEMTKAWVLKLGDPANEKPPSLFSLNNKTYWPPARWRQNTAVVGNLKLSTTPLQQLAMASSPNHMNKLVGDMSDIMSNVLARLSEISIDGPEISEALAQMDKKIKPFEAVFVIPRTAGKTMGAVETYEAMQKWLGGRTQAEKVLDAEKSMVIDSFPCEVITPKVYPGDSFRQKPHSVKKAKKLKAKSKGVNQRELLSRGPGRNTSKPNESSKLLSSLFKQNDLAADSSILYGGTGDDALVSLFFASMEWEVGFTYLRNTEAAIVDKLISMASEVKLQPAPCGIESDFTRLLFVNMKARDEALEFAKANKFQGWKISPGSPVSGYTHHYLAAMIRARPEVISMWHTGVDGAKTFAAMRADVQSRINTADLYRTYRRKSPSDLTQADLDIVLGADVVAQYKREIRDGVASLGRRLGQRGLTFAIDYALGND